MSNIRTALNEGSQFLKENLINTYQLDSEILLGKVLNKNREYLFLNNSEGINNNVLKEFQFLLNRRKNKEPIAYITNRKEFWKSSFYVDKNILIPPQIQRYLLRK